MRKSMERNPRARLEPVGVSICNPRHSHCDSFLQRDTKSVFKFINLEEWKMGLSPEYVSVFGSMRAFDNMVPPGLVSLCHLLWSSHDLPTSCQYTCLTVNPMHSKGWAATLDWPSYQIGLVISSLKSNFLHLIKMQKNLKKYKDSTKVGLPYL